MRALLRHPGLGFKQPHPRIAAGLDRLADHLVQSRVGAESQRVQVAGADEMRPGFFLVAQRQAASAPAVVQLRVPVIRSRGLLELLDRGADVAARLERDAGLEPGLPIRGLRRLQTRAVQRAEGRPVPQP